MYKIITLYYKRTGRAVGKSSRMLVLKKTIKNHKKELRKCVINDCVICKKDYNRDNENYMNA